MKVEIGLLFLLMFNSILAVSQESWTIYGTVKDDVGPIERCLVSISDSLGENYFYTDQKGQFEIKTTAPKIYLQARYLGYVSFDKWLSRKDTFHLTISLKPSAVIREIIVSEQRLPVEKTKDTLKYNLSYFRDSTERTVEDLLRKLPGITVDANGGIQVGGKSISKVLIEEDDLFGRKYTIGTKNIRADFIESIEVFNHYQTNAVLKDVKQSDAIVLNLKLKENKKSILSGGITSGAGVGDEIKFLLNANLFLIKKKFKYILITDNGNTGTQFGKNELDFIHSKDAWLDALSILDGEFTDQLQLQSLGMPNKFVDNGKAQFTTIRNVSRIGKNWKITPSIYYSLKKNAQKQYFSQSFRLDSNFYHIEQQSLINFSNEVGNISIKSNYLAPNQKSSFFVNVDINSSKHKGSQELVLNQVVSNGNKNADLLLRKKDLLIAGIYSKKIGKNRVIQFQSKISSLNFPQRMKLYNQDFELFPNSVYGKQLRQDLHFRSNLIDARSKLIQKVTDGFIEIAPFFTSEHTLLCTKIRSVLPDQSQALKSGLDFDKIGLKLVGQYAKPSLGKFNLILRSERILVRQPKTKLNADGNVYSISSRYGIIKGRHEYTVGGRYSEEQWLPEMFYSNDYFSSLQSYKYSRIQNEKSLYHGFFAKYRFDEPFRLFYLAITVDWLKGRNVWAKQHDFYRSITTQIDVKGGESSSLKARLTISKFFVKIKSDLRFTTGVRINKTPIALDSNVFVIAQQKIFNRAKLSILLFDRIRVMSVSEMIHSSLPDGREDKWWSYNQETKVFYTYKNWHFGVTNYYRQAVLRNRKFEDKKNTGLFVTKEWKTTRKSKDVRLQFDIVNLYNTSRYSNQFLSEQFSNSINVPAIPRYFIISFDYGF